MGALAQTSDGQYVQVNGDVVQPLNLFQVERALKAAKHREARYSNVRARAPGRAATSQVHSLRSPTTDPSNMPSNATVPVVIIKRRRIVRPE